MKRNPIVREIGDFMLPAILMFALYVQFHGDYSPGGGFQAGVIFAAGIIVYSLIHGLERTQRILPPAAVRAGASIGLLVYAGVGFACLFLGGRFLDYNALLPHPEGPNNPHGQELGIFLVELGVGITVAAVMITIFYAFAGRRDDP